jgi:hypothetical protein
MEGLVQISKDVNQLWEEMPKGNAQNKFDFSLFYV